MSKRKHSKTKISEKPKIRKRSTLFPWLKRNLLILDLENKTSAPPLFNFLLDFEQVLSCCRSFHIKQCKHIHKFNSLKVTENKTGWGTGSFAHLNFLFLFSDRVTIIELKLGTTSSVIILKYAFLSAIFSFFLDSCGVSLGSNRSFMRELNNKLIPNTSFSIKSLLDSRVRWIL